MRINKYIALCGVSSRRKAEEYILNGLVKINGKVVEDLSTKVNEKDVVTINDQIIKPTNDYVYYLLYKPKGYLTTMSDDRNRKTIVDLIDLDKRVFPVGRLDYDSEGALILTNDGDLAYRLTHPKFEIEKTYIVKICGEIKESELAVIRKGVVIDGVKFNKCKANLKEYKNNISKIEITLTEGKNREIRRIFEAIGREVIFLKRVEFAGIKLGGLKRKEMRPLKQEEINLLYKFTK